MGVLLYTLFLLAVAFGLHVLLWKIRLPRRQTKVLLTIFFSTLLIGLALLVTGSMPSLFPSVQPHLYLYELFQVALFFTGVTLAYMITYSAIEADSPSLVITQMVEESMPEGIEKNVFEERMNDDLLVRPRLRDLITDKIAVIEENEYRLTQKGKNMAILFRLFRKLLNAHKGG